MKVNFKIHSPDKQDVTWTATFKTYDGCGEAHPATGVVHGSGTASFVLTAPSSQKTILNLWLNATDAKGRRAKVRAFQVSYE